MNNFDRIAPYIIKGVSEEILSNIENIRKFIKDIIDQNNPNSVLYTDHAKKKNMMRSFRKGSVIFVRFIVLSLPI